MSTAMGQWAPSLRLAFQLYLWTPSRKSPKTHHGFYYQKCCLDINYTWCVMVALWFNIIIKYVIITPLDVTKDAPRDQTLRVSTCITDTPKCPQWLFGKVNIIEKMKK